MNKKNYIAASSIAEVVIAMSIIALCIGIASLVFTRSTMISGKFQDLRLQSDVQNMLWKQMQDQQSPMEIDDLTLEIEQGELPQLELYTYKNSDKSLVWQQEWLKDE